MIGRPRPWRSLVLAAVALPLAVTVLYGRERSFPAPPQTERLLYLRSGKVADRLMMSFDVIAADVYWIRAIQHYGRDLREFHPDRFGLLYPLLDLTTTLDPHFNIAYRFGAIFLAAPAPDGPGRTDLAIQLLRKGLAQNPTRWQYAHDIGFVHYWYTHDYAQAGEWFTRAAAMPNAPPWIQPLAALTMAQGGDREGARVLLENLARDASEEYIRNAALRGLAQLKALNAIDQLQEIVEAYASKHGGRYPGGWNDVFPGGAAPVDATGAPFVLDPKTHTVDVSPLSTLRPLPVVQRRR
ncbi:MAG: hypothetical protein R2752_07375 [Vicinamibacterales bacterium]